MTNLSKGHLGEVFGADVAVGHFADAFAVGKKCCFFCYLVCAVDWKCAIENYRIFVNFYLVDEERAVDVGVFGTCDNC